MKRRILVIDDSKAILDLLRIVLEREGYEVCALEEAHQATDEVMRFQPHLMILDFHLGADQNGWQLAQSLKRSPTTASTPVILCTAAIREVEDYQSLFREKNVPIVFKPFLIKGLLHTVRQSLLSSAQESAERPDTSYREP